MNISEKEERLKGILEHNIKNEKIGTAIAITGPWGVGKTFFWKSFLDKQLSNERIYTDGNVFNRKYAYVSLFGLESLSDLKTQIYSNIESFHSSVEIPKWIKGLPSIFKDSRVTQLGISAPVKLIDNLMFNRVNDAIICFDDFERMSNKLDIKDVMGLANYLKLEKNCQVILILDEDKAEGDNKKKYADYKEKLIDETIVINSVEPLIRENAKDIDEALVNLMIDFADKLDIHNFRFFQKVIKLYRDFRKSLPEVVADSTKEIILTRILQGFFIQDFGTASEVSWEDFRIVSESKQSEWSDKKKQTYLKFDRLFSSYNYFLKQDDWCLEFRKWFEQKDDFSNENLIKLAQSELISDSNNKLRDKLSALLDERDNYQASDDFIDRLYSISCQSIGISSLPDLRACISTLEDFEKSKKAKLLESKVISWIKEKLSKDRNAFKISGLFESHGFENIIQEFLKLNPNTPPLKDAIYHVYINNAYSDLDLESIRNADKSSLNQFIFKDFQEDERFINTRVHHLISRLPNQQKKFVIEILNERAQVSSFQKIYVNYLIAKLTDEEKES
ncbi:NTPase [Acinetobacter haemolyticus]|uniref:P-loop NTPase fold protein n=2 Tax=Acinetobacter TaxID=469 RepID=UPI000A5BE60B|nr:P-loop NTPase fold protein [Acinetobacter haemolyticus]NAR50384.1 NTPase [Acinetobacter haemolyticus]NAR84970.1 NTPase [Acinetobacter haemolyticus]NAS00902.1 NTPase [Acinetobacter haemolyticus]QHI24912.1 NTPase [Acinetobacter haemolyticus]QHI30872.1 NTPase [Acinetobacter haemolyticus]